LDNDWIKRLLASSPPIYSSDYIGFAPPEKERKKYKRRRRRRRRRRKGKGDVEMMMTLEFVEIMMILEIMMTLEFSSNCPSAVITHPYDAEYTPLRRA